MLDRDGAAERLGVRAPRSRAARRGHVRLLRRRGERRVDAARQRRGVPPLAAPSAGAGRRRRAVDRDDGARARRRAARARRTDARTSAWPTRTARPAWPARRPRPGTIMCLSTLLDHAAAEVVAHRERRAGPSSTCRATTGLAREVDRAGARDGIPRAAADGRRARARPARARPPHRVQRSRTRSRHPALGQARGHAPQRVRADLGIGHLARHRALRRARGAAGRRQGRAHRRGCAPRVRARRRRRSSSRTTAGGNSTAWRRRSTRCPRWSRRSTAGSRCCSTAASGAGPTSSRRSRSARAPCSPAGRRSGASRSTARRARRRVLELLRAEIELALQLVGCRTPAELTRSARRPQSPRR